MIKAENYLDKVVCPSLTRGTLTHPGSTLDNQPLIQ